MRLSAKSSVSTKAICSRHTKPSCVTVLPLSRWRRTSSAVKSCLAIFTTGAASPWPFSSQELSNSKPPPHAPRSSHSVIRLPGDCLACGRRASSPPKASRSLVSRFSALLPAPLISKKPCCVSQTACVRPVLVNARGSKSSVICSFNSCFSLRPTWRASASWIWAILSSRISRTTAAGSTFSDFFSDTAHVCCAGNTSSGEKPCGGAKPSLNQSRPVTGANSCSCRRSFSASGVKSGDLGRT